MPYFKMGELAVRSLLRSIDGEDVGHLVIEDEPRIHERDSVGRVAGAEATPGLEGAIGRGLVS